MSEEEIMLEIEEIKRIDRTRFTSSELQAIQGLLDLYNKEKEKNKECIKTGDLERAVGFLMNNNDLSNYISKDKIREKITECEEAMNKVKQFNPSTYAGIDTFIYAMAQKNILKSLLEEE